MKLVFPQSCQDRLSWRSLSVEISVRFYISTLNLHTPSLWARAQAHRRSFAIPNSSKISPSLVIAPKSNKISITQEAIAAGESAYCTYTAHPDCAGGFLFRYPSTHSSNDLAWRLRPHTHRQNWNGSKASTDVNLRLWIDLVAFHLYWI